MNWAKINPTARPTFNGSYGILFHSNIKPTGNVTMVTITNTVEPHALKLTIQSEEFAFRF